MHDLKCKVCDKPHNKPAQKCCSRNCASILQRKVPRPSRDEFAHDIYTMKIRAVARKYGVSSRTIESWVSQYKLLY